MNILNDSANLVATLKIAVLRGPFMMPEIKRGSGTYRARTISLSLEQHSSTFSQLWTSIYLHTVPQTSSYNQDSRHDWFSTFLHLWTSPGPCQWLKTIGLNGPNFLTYQSFTTRRQLNMSFLHQILPGVHWS